MNKSLGKLLAIPQAIRYGVKTAAGRVIPVYWDPKIALSQPNALKLVADEFALLCRQTGVKVVAGVETGGIGVAAATSLAVNLPWVYIRRQAKSYSLSKLVEGKYSTGAEALLVDDVVATASSKELFIENARGQLSIEHVAVVIDDSSGQASTILRKKGIVLHNLMKYEDLLQFMYDIGLLNKQMQEITTAYLVDRQGWHKQYELWEKFQKLTKKQIV